MKPLISIITPVYNNKRYLRKCADSILKQKYDNIEYIIVDDGSTDGTSDLCDEIAKDDSRVRVIHQENQWIYASFNNGIKAATGEYIYIVNSDDLLHDGALSKFADIISDYNPDVIWTAVRGVTCDDDQNPIGVEVHGLSGKLYPNDKFLNGIEEIHRNWKDLHFYGFSINQANLYRRSLMIKHPFRNDVFGADGLFNVSIADDIETSYILAEPIYDFNVYRKEGMNASIGKVYGYEFSMFSEMLSGHAKHLRNWNADIDDILYFEKIQVSTCINCLQILDNPKFNYSANDKLKIIINDYFNEKFYTEVKDIDCFEIIDSEVTKKILTYIIKGELTPDDSYYFFVPFVKAINNSVITDDDWGVIDKAINNPLNPYHYGITLCKKIAM